MNTAAMLFLYPKQISCCLVLLLFPPFFTCTMPFLSVNPYTQSLLRHFEEDDAAAVRQKIAASQKAFADWSRRPIAVRAALLEKLAERLLAGQEHYAALIVAEMGKPIREAKAEIMKCADCCKFYAAQAEAFLKDEYLTSAATRSYIQYQPLGAIFAIMPWNFPFWQVIRCAVPALAAGNVFLLKHAPNVPQCAEALEQLFAEAGFPPDVFQHLWIDLPLVEQVIAHPHVGAVSLTGSERAGASVAALAGKYLKKSVLELGGSDAFIVLDDAEPATVAAQAVRARMQNTGQSCIAAKRFIVLEAVFDDFVAAFKAQMQALQAGDPMQESTDYACLARPDLAAQLWQQVESSLEAGAACLLGGMAPEAGKAFFTPTILTALQPGMPAYEQELFGPVASIFKVTNEQEALALANASRYGLGGSVWSKNIDRAEALAKQLQSGSAFVNAMVKSDPRLPFGGTKLSGYGRELSYLGLREFTNIQTLWIA